MPGRALLRIAACCMASTIAPALADDVALFYKGRTLTMLIGTSTGGDVDGRARMLARHMGRHIPGNPAIVPRNMPGAVGAVAANWMSNVGPRDGTIIHAVMQGMPAHQALGGRGVEFDTARFNWIGNTVEGTNVVVVWSDSQISSIEDARSRVVIMGAPGSANNCVFYPLLLNALVGTKFKIIAGYPGGNDVKSCNGARRSRGEGLRNLDRLAEHQARVGRETQDTRARARRAAALAGPSPRSNADRTRHGRFRQIGDAIHVLRRRLQPCVCDVARRSRRARVSFAPSVRRNDDRCRIRPGSEED